MTSGQSIDALKRAKRNLEDAEEYIGLPKWDKTGILNNISLAGYHVNRAIELISELSAKGFLK